jgi:glycine hydroxymethyltransferase
MHASRGIHFCARIQVMESEYIHKQDQEVYAAIAGEDTRQANGLELIPSENYVSSAVREAMASTLTNKYSEGYPGKRYYGGQEYTDEVERLAIERAKEVFGAAFANVQPLGGANANIATYMALMEPGDTIIGMDLSHGGHLTHGHPVTYLSKMFTFVRYGMKDIETGEIDYDALQSLAEEHKPKVILAGFSSYPRTLDWKRIADIAHSVGAVAVADVAHIAGLIAGKAVENPFTHGFDVMTTTTHKTLRGPRGGMILVRESAELAQKIDKAVFPGFQGGPHMHQIAAKAIALKEAQSPQFAVYARQVIENAQAMADEFLQAEMRVITGGTDNHLVLVDVATSCGMGGKEAEQLLDSVGITLNKNIIPDDTRSPMDPSGIRFGTPALTTRGFTATECREVAQLMITVLRSKEGSADVRARVEELAKAHPIPESFI